MVLSGGNCMIGGAILASPDFLRRPGPVCLAPKLVRGGQAQRWGQRATTSRAVTLLSVLTLLVEL